MVYWGFQSQASCCKYCGMYMRPYNDLLSDLFPPEKHGLPGADLFYLDSFYCVWGHNAKTVITQKGINWWVIEREYEVGWNLFKYHIVWFLELTSGINCTKEFQSIWSAMFKFWHMTNSPPALWLEFNTMGCRIKWFSLFPWNSYGEKIKTKLNSLLPHQTILFIVTFREVGLATWYLGCCQMT